MKMDFESVEQLMSEFDKEMEQEKRECMAILDNAIDQIRNTKGVEEDVDSIEL